MQTSRILIVDDEANIRHILERTLRRENYCLEMASSGMEALQKIRENVYDLILLDLFMEPLGGIYVLEELRKIEPDTVVIILTAHGSVDSAVQALRLGAFDYLHKPAAPSIIRQRVQDGLQHRQQALRKRQLVSQIENIRQMLLEIEAQEVNLPAIGQRFLVRGSITIDLHHRSVTLGERLLELTTAEYDFLFCLVEAAPHPIGHCDLVRHALNYECQEREASEITKWHIFQLRQKIEPDPKQPRYIKTVRHKGYLWSGE
ncbi:MAG: response regulator transcription factor [Anaerolineales bacterium]|nr:response regulator transcription factor [Anaerolineales bacterium]